MNKPVAWMLNGILHECDPSDWAKEQYPDQDVIPLYTHPVNPKYDPETGEPLIDGYPLFSGLPHPVKELTDEVYFCSRCGKRLFDGIHTCTLPADILRKEQKK